MRISAGIAAGAIALASGVANATTVIDLINGDTGTANGTIYNWVDAQTTGTGVIDPFLRVQNAQGTEQGYNTDLASNNNPWETKAGTWTHDLLMSDLTLVNIGGVNYYEFLLDINETNNKTGRFISLDDVQIFTRSSGIAAVQEDLSILGINRYMMDVGSDGDVTVSLDYTRNPGSGAGDMLMYVLASNFAGAASTDHVYFYTKFGEHYDVDAGFEEWALRKASTAPCTSNCTPVPVPGTLALMGLGLVGLGWARRKQTA